MSRATYQYTREQVRTQIVIRLATSKIIQWLKIIKKVVFAIKDAHRYKNTMLQISVTRGFAGTITRSVFLDLQMKQHDLDFQIRENGKTIILFFFSFVMNCIFVVMLLLSCLLYLERHLVRTKNAVTLYFCIFCPNPQTLLFLV